MRRVWAICRKELATSFSSPVAYIVAAVFLVVSGFFFSLIITASREAHLRYVIHNINVTLLLISPLMTMRLFAEEKKMGTYELLMTAPITLFELVLGKFLGAALLFLAIVAVTLEYPLFLFWYGNPDPGPLATVYLGLILLGLCYMSVGMFASSLSDNQIVSAMVSFGLLLMLGIISWAGSQIAGPVGEFIRGISVFERFENFTRGVLDTGDVFFYVSITAIFFFLTIRSLDWRRW